MRRTAPADPLLLLITALFVTGSAAGCRGQGEQFAPDTHAPAARVRPDNLCADPKYAQIPVPPPDGLVNDFADVIDQPTEERLEGRLAELGERSRVEFAVVTVKDAGGVSVFDYSLAVGCGWGVGPKGGEGGGVVLLVAVEERQWRIQVNRSLEGDLPNEAVAEIGNGMAESFRRRLYGEGIIKGVEGVIDRLAERGRLEAR